MSKTELSITGSKELQAALKKMTDDAAKAVSQAVEATGIELRGDIVKRYDTGPASGFSYYTEFSGGYGKVMQVGTGDGGSDRVVAVFKSSGEHRTKTHQASAPGEAPMTDTGGLAGAMHYQRVSENSVVVLNRKQYAEWLEYGTKKILPRPAWVPAIEAMKVKFRKRLEAALKVSL